MTERELREKLQFAYGTMPDATRAAFEHSLTHHRVETRHPARMSRRMRTIVTLALMLMMLTAVGGKTGERDGLSAAVGADTGIHVTFGYAERSLRRRFAHAVR